MNYRRIKKAMKKFTNGRPVTIREYKAMEDYIKNEIQDKIKVLFRVSEALRRWAATIDR
jgi:hypothetical protein